MRVAILTSHPIQNQAPLFRELAARGGVEVRVFFCWDFGVRETHDLGFGRKIKWDVPLLEGYEYEFLSNVSPRPGSHHFLGLINPHARSRMLAWKPDAIIVHGYSHLTELDVALSSHWKRIPVFMRGESHLLAPRPVWLRAAKSILLRGLFRHTAGALTIGTLNADYYRHYGMRDEQLTLAPYSVDNHYFQSRASQASEEARQWKMKLGLGADQPVVLFAAKLIPIKGCADLIRAFAQADHRDAALVVVGDGPLRGQLQNLAAATNARVVFAGFANQSQMPAAYAMADVFVLPSHREPWGLAVNEAMNLGKAVIASNQVGCVPDLVCEDNGWVFPAGDVDSLRSTLEIALRDRVDLSRKGRRSLHRINGWGIGQTADGYLEGVRRVLHGDRLKAA